MQRHRSTRFYAVRRRRSSSALITTHPPRLTFPCFAKADLGLRQNSHPSRSPWACVAKLPARLLVPPAVIMQTVSYNSQLSNYQQFEKTQTRALWMWQAAPC